MIGRASARVLLVTGAVSFVAPVVSAPLARAEDGYDAQTREAVHDGSGAFSTWGVDPLDPGGLRVGFSADHARNPVVLQAGGDVIVPIVSRQTALEAAACYGLPFGIEAAVAVPFASRTVPNPLGVDGEGGVPESGVGDVRAAVKWRALTAEGFRPGLALVAGSSLPSGDARGWNGAGVTQPQVLFVAEERLGPARILANAGYRLRPGTAGSAWDVKQGDAFLYRGAVAVDTGFRGLAVLGEAFGATTAGGGPAPLEAGAGVRAPLVRGLVASAGANVGLSEAIGTPSWRAHASLSWEFSTGSPRPIPQRRPTTAAAPAEMPAPRTTPVPGSAATKAAASVSVAAAKPQAATSTATHSRPDSGATPVVMGSPGAVTPTPEALGRARLAAREGLSLYNSGDTPAAMQKFLAAATAESHLLPAERALVHKYIAFCHVAAGQRTEAKAAFVKALAADPALSLTTSSVSPKIVQVFTEVKAELATVSAPIAIPTVAAKVRVERDEIQLLRPVRFSPAAAVLDAVSIDVLDDVAEALAAHAEIKILKIEVYAESKTATDLALATARAKALRDHLVAKGAPASRVQFAGLPAASGKNVRLLIVSRK